ncbi:MAG: hypothetical protein NUW37_01635 [Planctomycetes bacterium]|nr:hypothetical protein [Planctomycetota bacterium]
MVFKDVHGHDHIFERLLRAKTRGMFPHAILFAGPKGVGKSLAARRLIQTMSCKAAEDKPCLACYPCRSIENGICPDLRILGKLEGKSQLTIDVIDEAIRFLSLKPSELGCKYLILEDAELMNVESANKLLKTLEEPLGHAALFLIRGSRKPSIATIESRCQKFVFAPLDDESLMLLLADLDLDDRQKAFIRAHGGGSPGYARKLIEEDVFHYAEKFLEAIFASREKNPYVLADAIMEFVSTGKSDETMIAKRPRLVRLLSILASVLMDAVKLAEGAIPSELTNAYLEKEMLVYAANSDRGKLLRNVEATLSAIKDIERNLHPTIVLENLFQTIWTRGWTA